MRFLLFASLIAASVSARAGQTLEYKTGKTTMEGYIAIPETKRLKNPAVIIVPDWMGPGEFSRRKADEMAKLGYVALAADVYGKEVRPKDAKEAGQAAGALKADVKTLRERMTAAFETLKKRPDVDPAKIVVFGYCFGGTSALELGRTGAPLAGIATFHGGLATPNLDDAKKIKAKVLVMHGAIDPYVGEKEVADFKKAMNDAGVDYQFISYSGAVHSFTIPGAGNDVKAGAAYNATADKRSWVAFRQFLDEVNPL